MTAGLPKKSFLYLPGTQLKQVFIFYRNIGQQSAILLVRPQSTDWKEVTDSTNNEIV